MIQQKPMTNLSRKYSFSINHNIRLNNLNLDIKSQKINNNIINKMFENNLQSASYFDIFDPNMPIEKTKNLYKLEHVMTNHKVHDKDVKSNVFVFANRSSSIVFPKNQMKMLGLIQRYLNLQVFVFGNLGAWSIELGISDQNKIKRRVILGSNIAKQQIKTFSIKYPVEITEGWSNITIDLFSFMKAFPNQEYKSLDSIHMSGFFKLRKIFTTKTAIFMPNTHTYVQAYDKNKNSFIVPRNYYLPEQLKSQNLYLKYRQTSIVTENEYEGTHYLHPHVQAHNRNDIKLRQSQVSTKNDSLNKIKQSQGIKLPKIGGRHVSGSKNKDKDFIENIQKNRVNNIIKMSKQLVNLQTQRTYINNISQNSTTNNTNNNKTKIIQQYNNPKTSNNTNTNTNNIRNKQKKILSHRKLYKKNQIFTLDQLVNRKIKVQSPGKSGNHKYVLGDVKVNETKVRDSNNDNNGNFDDIHKKQIDENLYGKQRKSKTLEPKVPKRRKIIFNGIQKNIIQTNSNNNHEHPQPQHHQIKIHKPHKQIQKQTSIQNHLQPCSPCQTLKKKEQQDSDYALKSSRFSSIYQSRQTTRHGWTADVNNINNQYIEEDIENESSILCQEENQGNGNVRAVNQGLLMKPVELTITRKQQYPQQEQDFSYEQQLNPKTTNPQKKPQKNSYKGFSQMLLNKYLTQNERPYSPPLLSQQNQPQHQYSYSKQCHNLDYGIIRQDSLEEESGCKKLQLLYDPILECYYDCRSGTYYQLKK